MLIEYDARPVAKSNPWCEYCAGWYEIQRANMVPRELNTVNSRIIRPACVCGSVWQTEFDSVWKDELPILVRTIFTNEPHTLWTEIAVQINNAARESILLRIKLRECGMEVPGAGWFYSERCIFRMSQPRTYTRCQRQLPNLSGVDPNLNDQVIYWSFRTNVPMDWVTYELRGRPYYCMNNLLHRHYTLIRATNDKRKRGYGENKCRWIKYKPS